ncbi:MAG TPA: alpha/beta hydrolase, partial [Trinickia sp.]|jgi:pimeloyl-ACP methyl ester carboxylesterase|nr:alpha/beta hydrolase [Trinickia sp.]
MGLGLAGLPGTPIRKLLLNDVGPHIEPPALERIGSYVGKPVRFATLQEGIDHAAMLAESFGPLTQDEWREINTPLLRERSDGAWEFRYDPAIAVPFGVSSPEASAAGEAALWYSLQSIASPVLVVRGAQSDLLSPETVAQMVARGRAVSSVEIPGVGHAPAFLDAAQIGVARRFFLGEREAAS